MKRILFFLGLFFLLFLTSEALEVPQKNIKDNSLFLRSLSTYLLGGTQRKNLQYQDVPATFCAFNSTTQQCDWLNYAESIIFLVIPGCIVGVILFLILICFAISKRCCCSSPRASVSEIVAVKIAIVITVIFISAALIVAFVGNQNAHTGSNNSIQNSINFAQLIENLAVNVTTTVSSVPGYSNLNFGGTLQAVQSLINTSQSAQVVFQQYEGYRFDVFVAAYVLLIVMCIVAFVSIFIWCCASGCINFCLGILEILFMWLVFSICLALGNANTDVCQAFDGELAAYSNGQKNSDIFSSLLGQFGANCSAFAELEQQSINAFTNYSQQFCNQYNSLCNGNSSTSLKNCQNCTQNSNFNILVDTTQIAELVSCPSTMCPVTCPVGSTCSTGIISIFNCSTACYTQQERNSAGEAVTLAAYREELKAVIAELQPYLGCSFIIAFIQAIYDPVCNQFLYGLELLVVGSVIVGILLIAFNIEMVYSIDKFDPSKRNDGAVEGDEYWEENKAKPAANAYWGGTIGFIPNQSFAIKGSEGFTMDRIHPSGDNYAFGQRGEIPNFQEPPKVEEVPPQYAEAPPPYVQPTVQPEIPPQHEEPKTPGEMAPSLYPDIHGMDMAPPPYSDVKGNSTDN